MSEINAGLKIFIERLKKIDVPDLLEKAKTINIEDLRSLKWSDLKKIIKSPVFLPLIGLTSASLFTILLLIPSYKSISEIKDKSNIYLYESSRLSELNNKLKERIKLHKDVEKELNLISSDLIAKNNLIRITRLLDDAAKTNFISITEFVPITQEEVQSCSSISEEEMSNNMNYQQNYGRDDVGLMGESTSNNSFDPNNNELPLDIINSNESYNDPLQDVIPKQKISSLFTSKANNLPPRLSSNYYMLQLQSDYIHSINFLRSLQEFKASIIPICFEVKSIASTNNIGNINSPISSKSIEARLFINVPTK